MNPIQKVFPRYAAAAAQVRVHGDDGARFARDAWNSPDDAVRLDKAVRAYNSFDHALAASENLPLDSLVPPLAGYRAGYQAAKTAATLLVASGAIPGARERVGKQELLAAREELHRGVLQAADDSSRFGRYRALDFIDASFEDATSGVLMLRKASVALPLLTGLRDVRQSVVRREPIEPELVDRLDGLFRKAAGVLDHQIDELTAQPANTLDPATRAKVDHLLASAAGGAALAAPPATAGVA